MSSRFFDDVRETRYFNQQCSRLRAIGIVLWSRFRESLAIALCAVFDHRLRDLDPGNPEVGPHPQVVCTRCGDEF